MKIPISAIILTFNEELNIEGCFKSVVDWVREVIIIDSYSTDKTLEIAKKYNAKIFQHPFENQAKQFNWALDNLDIKGEWILRLDADERMTPELFKEIDITLPKIPSDVSGFYIMRKVFFMKQWIRYGGYYPTWLLRLFRKGIARFEEREMDEHLKLSSGKILKLKNAFFEEDQKDLTIWIAKHNGYAKREAQAILNPEKNLITPSLFGSQVEQKRWFKEKIYNHLPLFIRPFLYFIYRYIFRLGFLDGKSGMIFHFLQGWWYRFLVDAKIFEKQKNKKSKLANIAVKEKDRALVSVIILAYNEELNIRECLDSINGWADEIFIVLDSRSNDTTEDIARQYTDKIYKHPFVDWGDQFNWALDNLPIKNKWVFRLDADERVTQEVRRDLSKLLPMLSDDVSGVEIKKKFYFLGRWIHYGGHFLYWLRFLRKGRARFESRPMDEHLIFSNGKIIKINSAFVEDDKRDLTYWVDKHNKYANREVEAILNPTKSLIRPKILGSVAERKRWFKEKIYSRLPFFLRAFLFFVYRYFFRLGFLDGKEGLIFYFLQTFWYRFLVDAKLFEYKIRKEK